MLWTPFLYYKGSQNGLQSYCKSFSTQKYNGSVSYASAKPAFLPPILWWKRIFWRKATYTQLRRVVGYNARKPDVNQQHCPMCIWKHVNTRQPSLVFERFYNIVAGKTTWGRLCHLMKGPFFEAGNKEGLVKVIFIKWHLLEVTSH